MATRWATDDLSGMILDSNPKAKRLSFPAISENGFALVPELHPIEKLLEVKTTVSSHFWSAMYQQSPTVLGGGIFKTEWWKYYAGNIEFWNKHKALNNGALRRLMIEDKSSGTGLIQQMKQKGMQVGAIKRNTDKVTRAYDTSPPVEAGRVFLPSNADYLADYLIEF